MGVIRWRALGCLLVVLAQSWLWVAGCEDPERAPRLGPTPPSASVAQGGTMLIAVGGSGGSSGDYVIADPLAPCDDGLEVDETDPLMAARAVEICQSATDADWGIVGAQWVLADGSPVGTLPNYELGHGVLPSFGKQVEPLAGQRLLALSSGTARRPSDPDYAWPSGFTKGYGCDSPTGYPKESEACAAVLTGEPFDCVALELTLKAPPQADGLAFNFNFFTYEWPVYVCSVFNDFFIALLDPPPPGQDDANISFDELGNPVSVNNALVRVCDCANKPCYAPPDAPQKKYYCELGPQQLVDTGFEDHAATGWLETKAPIAPGDTVTLRWVVYDSGDHVLDSTVVIDNFRWLGQAPLDAGTVPIPK